MSGSLSLLIACVFVSTVWLVMHAVLVVRCAQSDTLTVGQRWLAVVPPVTGWLGWRAGHRRLVIGWTCLIVLYLVLRGGLAALTP